MLRDPKEGRARTVHHEDPGEMSDAVRPSVRLFVCLSVCASVSISVCASACQSVSQSVCLLCIVEKCRVLYSTV